MNFVDFVALDVEALCTSRKIEGSVIIYERVVIEQNMNAFCVKETQPSPVLKIAFEKKKDKRNLWRILWFSTTSKIITDQDVEKYWKFLFR